MRPVPTGHVELATSDTPTGPECVTVAELEGRANGSRALDKLYRELREEAGERGGNRVEIIELGPPPIGESILVGFAAILLGAPDPFAFDEALVAKAVALRCPPNEAERWLRSVRAPPARPVHEPAVARAPEIRALVGPDETHSVVVISGYVTMVRRNQPSTYVVVSVAGRQAIVDENGRYSIGMRVPNEECESLSVTVSRLTPDDTDVLAERPVGSCGEHRMDFWR